MFVTLSGPMRNIKVKEGKTISASRQFIIDKFKYASSIDHKKIK